MPTPRLGLPLILGGQAQKHVTHNESLAILDGLLPGVVVSATTATAPASPAEGECYIVPTAGGFGSVPRGQIAVYQGGFWMAAPSAFGHRVLVLDEGRERVNSGSRGWLPGQIAGALGGAAGLRVLDFDVVTSGAPTITVANAIPARVIVLAVSAWVVQTITGTTQWRVGDNTDPGRFGGSIASAGGRNIGVVGPFATYDPAPLIVGRQSGTENMTGGRVRLSLAVIGFDDGLDGVGA